MPKRKHSTTTTLLLTITPLLTTSTNEHQHYCGTSWPDAFDKCHKPCPTQSDDECTGVGGDASWKCFGYTGCVDKLNDVTEPAEGVQEGPPENVQSTTEDSDFYCGTSWTHAMVSCSTTCPSGDDTQCPSGQICFAAANCATPLITLTSELVVTMSGPDSVMAGVEKEIFGSTLDEVIGEAAGGEGGLNLRGVDLGGQSLSLRRGLVDVNVTSVVGRRRLPLGSSALDVSVTVTGEYRPPPYLDLDVICQDSINRDSNRVVDSLQRRGSDMGRDFFDSVRGIEAVPRRDFTKRPTRAPTNRPTTKAPTPAPSGSPTKKPTSGPTGSPTSMPSDFPSAEPSDFPSSEPTRAIVQNIMTGSQELLSVGGDTTSSFGYLFNIRTKPGSPVVIIQALEFFTKSTKKMKYELWSRIGNFKDFKGSLDGWEAISKGSVTGGGPGVYTAIPLDKFTPVDIPGGGGDKGTRAFYLTLRTKDLVYNFGEGTESDSVIQFETPELELWEGEGVLLYPMPDVSQQMYYRYPRQFLGKIYYDRLPCRPYSAFGVISELPCPDIPTQSPSLPLPTLSPVTPAPTLAPITPPPTEAPSLATTPPPTLLQSQLTNVDTSASPFVDTPAPIITNRPTLSPSLSNVPSVAPSSASPTLSPVVRMQANITVTLHNVPDRTMSDSEAEAFTHVMLEFLQRYTEQTLILDVIDIWHQHVILVNALTTEIERNSNDTSANHTVSNIGNSSDLIVQSYELHQGQRELRGNNGGGGSSSNSLEQYKLDKIIAFKQKHMDRGPKTTGLQITLILLIPFAYLPEELLGKFAAVTIQEHNLELVHLLRRQSSFYSYFKELDGISSESIEKLTMPPTSMPTSYEQFVELQKIEQRFAEVSEEQNFWHMIGVGFLLFWLFLTKVSIVCLFKARWEMKERKKMQDLLSHERSSAKPLTDELQLENNTEMKWLKQQSSDEEETLYSLDISETNTKSSGDRLSFNLSEKDEGEKLTVKKTQSTRDLARRDADHKLNELDINNLLGLPPTEEEMPVEPTKSISLNKPKLMKNASNRRSIVSSAGKTKIEQPVKKTQSTRDLARRDAGHKLNELDINNLLGLPPTEEEMPVEPDTKSISLNKPKLKKNASNRRSIVSSAGKTKIEQPLDISTSSRTDDVASTEFKRKASTESHRKSVNLSTVKPKQDNYLDLSDSCDVEKDTNPTAARRSTKARSRTETNAKSITSSKVKTQQQNNLEANFHTFDDLFSINEDEKRIDSADVRHKRASANAKPSTLTKSRSKSQVVDDLHTFNDLFSTGDMEHASSQDPEKARRKTVAASDRKPAPTSKRKTIRGSKAEANAQNLNGSYVANNSSKAKRKTLTHVNIKSDSHSRGSKTHEQNINDLFGIADSSNAKHQPSSKRSSGRRRDGPKDKSLQEKLSNFDIV